MLVVVVDIGIGNLHSVQKAVETAGLEYGRGLSVRRSADPAELLRADRIIMPGQSGFRDAARALFASGLSEALLECINRGTPYLGICLGLQLLFDASDEAPGERGLGLFRGRVERLKGGPSVKIPHMGWNQLSIEHGGHRCLDAAGGNGAWLYFVHSFSATPDDESVLKAVVSYGPNRVTAAVSHENVLATQFHPEKSQKAGLALLLAFLRA